jgi:ribosomal protein S12 methylthiotransferase accessory factor YcaO
LIHDDRSLLSSDTQNWLKSATIEQHEYVVPIKEESVADSVFATDTMADDIETCVRLCRQSGLELLMLDLTRPDVGFPVVRMVVPGLRHFWARLAPGRLYDVPPRLGWIPRKLEEDELNPVPFFL